MTGTPSGYQTYLYWYLALLVVILTTAGFNWIVDPYAIHHDFRIAGFNAAKTERQKHDRMSKAREVARLTPASVILGSSRAAVGLDADHPGWSNPTTGSFSDRPLF